MRVPSELYQMQSELSVRFPALRPAQQRGLALWVLGAVLARSACQSAVLAALVAAGLARPHALRQRLREWLYDGADKAKPCASEIVVEGCFAPLLGWVLALWRGPRKLALAIDATTHGDWLTALVVSVLYRGTAIPVAWAILPGNTKGPWLDPILGLLERLRAALPVEEGWTVLVLADRGLWSPRLWHGIGKLGWHPLLRVQQTITFAPACGGQRGPACGLVGPGQAWVGRGGLRAQEPKLTVTLIAVWTAAQKEPWVVVTDLAPEQVGIAWYALRMSIELGFRVLKSLGWHWQHTRRRDPRRVARHWLILAIATLWTLACGTRAEEAEETGQPPARLCLPPPRGSDRPRRPRRVSVFRRGLEVFCRCLVRGRLWRRLWLAPDPWPQPPADLQITCHGAPS
jgi:hypothetical protein